MSTRRVSFAASTDNVHSPSSSIRSSHNSDENQRRQEEINISNAIANQQIRQNRAYIVKCINIMYLSFLCFTGVFLIGMNSGFTGIGLWTCPVLSVPYIASWISMATGILMAVLALLSMFVMCIGMAKGGFKPFIIILCFSWVGLLVALILSAHFQSQVKSPNFAQSITNLFIEAKNSFLTNTVKLTNSHGGGPLPCFNHIQKTLDCCGVYLYSDWWLLIGEPDPTETPSIDDSNSTSTDEFNNNYTTDYPINTTTLPVFANSDRHFSNSTPRDIPHSCFCKHQDYQHPNYDRKCVAVYVKGFSRSKLINYRGCLEPIQEIIGRHLTVILIACAIILLIQIAHFLITVYCSIRANRRCAVDVYGFTPETIATILFSHNNAPNS